MSLRLAIVSLSSECIWKISVLKHEQNRRLKRVGCLLLAAHFLFVFCAVDLLHADDCSYVNGTPIGPDDGCPACLFKSGAHAEQPIFFDASAPFCFMEQQIAAPAEIVHGSEPACFLQLRAPPA